jgi:hypothetical protein
VRPVFSSICTPEITIAWVIDDSLVCRRWALVNDREILNACYSYPTRISIKHHRESQLTDLILVIGSVHNADVFYRGREVTDITPEEDWLASLDCPHDCGFEFITRRVDVWKTN